MKKVLLWVVALVWGCTSYCQTGGRIATGAEQLVSAEQAAFLQQLVNKNGVAVVANQASMVGDKHLVDTLLSIGVRIKTIFCPEHGFRGDSEAGAKVKDCIDAKTGLPLVSLYGSNKKPSAESLKGVDLILFDLQDVGCRFYTYISTLQYVMEAAYEQDKEFWLLDRPNPNGGYVDGPVLEEKYRSFVGVHPGVPVVYGMTIGEYAMMIVGEGWDSSAPRDTLKDKPVVVRLKNYTHDSVYRLPIAPSPNLRTPQAIALYPSLCLFEGTNVSVGRGTDKPFEVIGRPSYTDHSFSFVPKSMPGVSANPPHKGKRCYGCDLSDVEVRRCFDLSYLLEMYNNSDKNTFFLKSNFFDLLAGTRMLREQLEKGIPEEEIRASWQPALDRFKRVREKYLLYD